MKKLRRFTIKPGSQPNSEINVTPLVDVVLVLLIIFMVVTPLLEKDIAVRVPPTEQAAQPDELPPDQLLIRLDESGGLHLNDEDVAEERYVARLGELLAARTDKTVFVNADDRAPYPALVHVLDGAKQAGALTLGMATSPPE